MSNQNLTFNFSVTGREAELIGSALAKFPYEQVASLMNRLQASINEQLAQIEAAKVAAAQAEAAKVAAAQAEAAKVAAAQAEAARIAAAQAEAAKVVDSVAVGDGSQPAATEVA